MCRVSFEPCLNTIGSTLDANLCGKRDFINDLFVCSRSSAFLRLNGPQTRRLGQSPLETISYTTMNSGCLSKSLHLISERDISRFEDPQLSLGVVGS